MILTTFGHRCYFNNLANQRKEKKQLRVHSTQLFDIFLLVSQTSQPIKSTTTARSTF